MRNEVKLSNPRIKPKLANFFLTVLNSNLSQNYLPILFVTNREIISRTVTASNVKTSTLIRYQFQMRLHNDGIEVLYTTIIL